MAQVIKIKQSSVAGKVPSTTDLVLGELAVNTYDGKAFMKKNVAGTETVVDLSANQSITVSGDATGSGTTAIALTLANSGVTAGTYKSVTVDAKGRVTAGTNPTTLSGYGITDAAPLASPVLTGTPTAPTAPAGTNTTQLATTAFVASAVSSALTGGSFGGSFSTITTSGAASVGGNLTVTGNLTINGTTTTVNSTTVTVDDPIITIGGDTAPTVDDGKDRGVEFRWHNGTAAKVGFFGFDKSTGYFTFIPDATNTSEVFSGAAGTIQASLAGNASTATQLQTARTLSVSGDATGSASFDGSANAAIALTLANSGVTAGTYKSVTVDAKGRVTAGTNPTTLSGYGITDAQPLDADLTAIAALLGTSGFLKKTAANTWALDTNTYLTGNQTITVSGDASGSGTTAIALTLANSGVTAGTYKSVTVDAKGRVTAGTNPTTLAGYGITDAAPLASPALTGTPTAPTAASGTNTTQIATTAFVTSAITTALGGSGGGATFSTLTTTGAADIGGNLTVTGNLTVNGTTTTVNSTVTTIDDPVITLGGDTAPATDDGKDRGVEYRWHNGTVAKTGFFGYDDSTGYFTFIPDATNTSEVFSGTKGTIDANLLGNVTGNADTATKLATARTISTTGDATGSALFDGSANASIALTLANSGVTAGTYNNSATAITPFTVDAKGRVTAAGAAVTVTPAWSSITSKPTTLSGYGITDAALATHNHTVDGLSNVTIASKASGDVITWNGAAWVNTTQSALVAGNATKLSTGRTIALTGDVTYTSGAFDGSANVTGAATLAASGVTAGTYGSATQVGTFTVDAKGRLTAASNVTVTPAFSSITGKPTTLAGYGITDSVQLTGTLPLSVADITSATLTTTTTTANQVVDSFAAATYRTAKYLVQATSGTAYQAIEVLVIHDGTTAYMVEYGNVATSSSLVTLDADVSAGNVRLLATPVNAATTLRVVRTSIDV